MGEGLGGVLGLDHPGEVRGREGLQVEAALARLHRHAVFLGLQRNLGVLGKGAQDVVELARARGHRPLGIAVQLRAGGDLHLKVGRQEVHLASGRADEHVGEDRKRVAALDDTRDLLQRAQEPVVRCSDLEHDLLIF
jgi:hypothetical protein